ncbi:MAG: VOC family protein [Thermomicrobiales bacterium]
MPLSIDHIVIAVRDLAQASADYAEAGFTVTPGGWHTGGATHNSLISFADGAYFELIAFADPDREQPHKWWPRFAKGEGAVDFALCSSDLGAEAERLRAGGLTVEGPTDGGRQRPDGETLAWRSVTLGTGIPLPFVIEDVTLRELRVPPAPATEHSSGVTGVAGLVMLVPELAAASGAYRALLGVEESPLKRPLRACARCVATGWASSGLILRSRRWRRSNSGVILRTMLRARTRSSWRRRRRDIRRCRQPWRTAPISDSSPLNRSTAMSNLREYLVQKRERLLAKRAAAAEKAPDPLQIAATVRAEGRSGIRRIRIRDYQIITDSATDFAGYGLGPTAPELQLGVLGSCLAHSFLIQAADRQTPIDALEVAVAAEIDARAGQPGYPDITVHPRQIRYTLRVESPASAEEIATLQAAMENACPILSLLRNPHEISGAVELTAAT